MGHSGGQPGQAAPRAGHGSIQVALWLIVSLLAVHAALMVLEPGSRPAWGQAAPPGGVRGDASGVYVVPAQIDKDLWGAYLVDTRAGTVVLYQYSPNSRKLKLVAARSFMYDRYLENYNTDEPSPAEIADIISKARPIRPRPVEPKPSGSGESDKPGP